VLAVKALLKKVASSGVDRLTDRREWHRQGFGGQGPPLQQRPCVEAVHEYHLLGDRAADGNPTP
jgi:hypothetical protein